MESGTKVGKCLLPIHALSNQLKLKSERSPAHQLGRGIFINPKLRRHHILRDGNLGEVKEEPLM